MARKKKKKEKKDTKQKKKPKKKERRSGPGAGLEAPGGRWNGREDGFERTGRRPACHSGGVALG